MSASGTFFSTTCSSARGASASWNAAPGWPGQNGEAGFLEMCRTCTIGRASFTPEALKSNLTALIDALSKARPQGIKGIYFRKVSVSSTMGAGVRVDTASLNISQSAAH